jgi:RimJ/RimL family protein N-acetyltransferase
MPTAAMPGPEPLPRKGSRTVLRRLAAGDLDAFQAYRHDAEVQRYQGWQPQQDSDALAFIEEMAIAPLFQRGQWVQIGIADARNDALIGDIGMLVAADGQSAEIGFTICPPSQGRGLGTDAVGQAIRLLFECTAAARIVGVTDSLNSASIRLLERVGMRRDATRHVVFNAETCIEHTYAISRHDHGCRPDRDEVRTE